MLLEEQRFIHEDLERLEQAIADRVAEEPRNVSYISLDSSYLSQELKCCRSSDPGRFSSRS